MKTRDAAVFVMAGQPLPGSCNTRLSSHLSARQACLFDEAFLRDTVELVMEAAVRGRFLCYGPPAGRDWFASNFVGIDLMQQAAGDSGEALSCAFDTIFALGYGAVIALGVDTPDLPAGLIEQAVKTLDACDVVIGPSADGGYYLIGMTEPAPELFRRINWGTSSVTEETFARASELGLRVETLDEWSDVDDIEQLRELAESETLRANSKTLLEKTKPGRFSRILPGLTRPRREPKG